MPNRLPLRLTALALAMSFALPLLASAADTAADAPAPETKSLDTVIVTGTRSTTRTEAESLSPIDVLTPADLQSSGASDLASAMASLLPSMDFPRPAINDGNDALRPATLRGLSPDQVLVLVDGKRFHTSALVNYNSSVGRGSAPVDLNAIPISAIDHIEVLRDGASAQYGSDAIAGVINIVLKHGAKEGSNDIEINGGQMSKGDGAQNGIAGSVGYAFGPTDADGKAPGWARISFNYQDVMNTNRSANTDPSTNLPGRNPTRSCPTPESPTDQCPYERLGDPAVVTYQALGNFGYTISPEIELYGYIDASRRDVTSNGYYRAYDNNRNVPEIYPDGFLPRIVNHTNDLNAVFGARGTLDNGWHWDASVDYGKNHLVFDIANSVNTNLYYSLGYSPTYFYAGTFNNAQTVYSLDLSKDFNWGFLPNPVTFAWGVEYRNEQFSIRHGQPESYYDNFDTPYAGGSQVYPGLSPIVAGSFNRHNEAAYVDFETNITDKLSAGVAARYEDYSDAGATRSGKISARYQFTDTFALRGTLSNGFRAPSLAQSDYESVVTLIQNGQLAQIGTFRTSNPAAIILGAKPLTPEKSTNFSIGSVWQPFENFSSTLDLYQIRIAHQIVYSDQIPVDPTPENPVTGAQFFVNGADTRTRGADIINSYSMDLDNYGILKLTVSGNWNQTSIIADTAPSHLVDGVPVTDFGRSSQGLLTFATPRTKYVLGGDWQFKGFDVNANFTRYGAVTRIGDDANGDEDQKFAARWLLNLATSYTWNAWKFTVGADNVFNTYPTKVNVASGSDLEDYFDGLQYSSLSPFGFNGRYAYVKVGYKF
jgi:iron complex outermembrane receptor protein